MKTTDYLLRVLNHPRFRGNLGAIYRLRFVSCTGPSIGGYRSEDQAEQTRADLPYSDPSAAVRLQRFQDATKAAAALIGQGHMVFSPITMTHPIDLEMAGSGNTLGSNFWVLFDEVFMERCDVFVLLPLEGWQMKVSRLS